MSVPPPQSIQALNMKFDDFDYFSEAALHWDIHFRQLGGGPFRGSINQLSGSAGSLLSAEWNQKMEQWGNPPPGCRTFCLPIKRADDLRWQSHRFDEATWGVIQRGDDLATTSPAGFVVVGISITDKLIEEAGELLEIDSPHALLDRNSFIRGHSSETNRIRQLCARLLDLRTSPQLNDSVFRAGMLEITCGLLSSFEKPTRTWKPPRVSFRNQSLKRALTHIREASDHPLSVDELSRRAGASIRTIRYAFRETFGISPKEYLQAYRLNHVRSRLSNSDPRYVRVSDIANEYGFWHLGQFAKDYRKMFAELPSETLAR